MADEGKIRDLEARIAGIVGALSIQQKNLGVLRSADVASGLAVLERVCAGDHTIMQTVDDVGLIASGLAEEYIYADDKKSLEQIKPLIAKLADVRRQCLNASTELKELNKRLSSHLN